MVLLLPLLLVGVSLLSGCTENNEDIYSLNKPPIAAITILNEYPIWWNDYLAVSAEESYDPDGGDLTGFIWWFTSHSKTTNEGASKHGESVSYHLPTQTEWLWESYPDGNYEIELMVVDTNGTVGITSEKITIYPYPRIRLEQIDNTHLLELHVGDYDSEGSFPSLKPKEVRVNYAKLDGESWGHGFPGPLFRDAQIWSDGYYHDVDEDGNVSDGDTLDLDKIFEKEVSSGSFVTIELTGGEWHNSENILNPMTRKLLIR